MVSPSGQGGSSSSSAAGSKTVDVDQHLKAKSRDLQNGSREVVVGRQTNSVRARLPSRSAEHSVFKVEDDCLVTVLADSDRIGKITTITQLKHPNIYLFIYLNKSY